MLKFELGLSPFKVIILPAAFFPKQKKWYSTYNEKKTIKIEKTRQNTTGLDRR